jgi:ergothioneine biosynthesis protein EgtB
MTMPVSSTLDRAAALDRFRHMRARTRALFDLVDASVYYDRPIALRNPVVFYEGHLPAFAVNALIKKGLGGRGIDARLEEIFARGIDPDTEATAMARGNPAWPSRTAVRQYAAAADRVIEAAIETADLEASGQPLLDRAQALWAILEHEEMHQETLAYMWHELPYDKKRKPAGYVTAPASAENSQLPLPNAQLESRPDLGAGSWRLGVEPVQIPSGVATLGTAQDESPFAWDNELPSHTVRVPAFAIDTHKVTNAQFMSFVDAGGYGDPRWWRPDDWSWIVSAGLKHPRFWEHDGGRWYWRGMFERVPLPGNWPVYVTWAEAAAYSRWRGASLPTEAEFHRAAFATPSGYERQYPWGDTLNGPPPGNFDFVRWDPEPVDARPDGASACGVHGLVGNGWEWTATVFAPFAGFMPLPSYPEYSADFFDGDHFVMKGASPVTARALTRRGFRNWFRPRYPYVYAGFRCVQDR